MAYHFFEELGIKDVRLHLNSLGNPESRAHLSPSLIDYLTPLKDQLSKDSQRRLEENPPRARLKKKRRQGCCRKCTIHLGLSGSGKYSSF